MKNYNHRFHHPHVFRYRGVHVVASQSGSHGAAREKCCGWHAFRGNDEIRESVEYRAQSRLAKSKTRGYCAYHRFANFNCSFTLYFRRFWTVVWLSSLHELPSLSVVPYSWFQTWQSSSARHQFAKERCLSMKSEAKMFCAYIRGNIIGLLD